MQLKKHKHLVIFISLMLGITLSAYSDDTTILNENKSFSTVIKSAAVDQPSSPKSKPQETFSLPQAIKVAFYAKPNSKRPVAWVDVEAPLVPIYRQGKWIKVGNQRNGEVGWIYQPDYDKAWERYLEPNINAIYVNRTQDGKDIDILAYRNGKKLSEKEAKELYERIRKQQKDLDKLSQQYAKDFWRLQQQMNVLMRQQMVESQHDSEEILQLQEKED